MPFANMKDEVAKMVKESFKEEQQKMKEKKRKKMKEKKRKTNVRKNEDIKGKCKKKFESEEECKSISDFDSESGSDGDVSVPVPVRQRKQEVDAPEFVQVVERSWKCQFRCYLLYFEKFIAENRDNISEDVKKRLNDTPFNHLLRAFIDGDIERRDCYKLDNAIAIMVDAYSKENREFHFHHSRVHHITPDYIASLLGLSTKGFLIPVIDKDVQISGWLLDLFGSKDIKKEDICTLLKKTFGKKEMVDECVILLVLLLLAFALLPISKGTLAVGFANCVTSIELMKQYAWATVVLDKLFDALDTYSRNYLLEVAMKKEQAKKLKEKKAGGKMKFVKADNDDDDEEEDDKKRENVINAGACCIIILLNKEKGRSIPRWAWLSTASVILWLISKKIKTLELLRTIYFLNARTKKTKDHTKADKADSVIVPVLESINDLL